MLIVDAHLDLAMNALQWNRDLLASVYTIRVLEKDTPGKGRGQGTVALPEMRRGRVALSFATAIARSTGRPVPHIDYLSPAQAYAAGQGHIAYYHALERQGHVRLIRDAEELDRHMEEWVAWDARQPAGGEAATPPLGFVLAMEGADPILDAGDVEAWWRQGLRMISLSHYGPGRYAGGTGTEAGLSDAAIPLLSEMRRLNIILDLTHCSDQAFWQALERFDGQVVASHNNCRALAPHQRQFSDDQIRAIAARGGVIGAALDCWMIAPGWRHGDSNASVRLDDVARHIDYICQLLGTARHVAIGSDLDGGFGREGSPSDLDTIADLQRIAGALAQRGYSDQDIAAIMYRNWWALLRAVWTRNAPRA
ncbi:MAG: membrane dipeptidase [Armatimonadota bacterium]|nr:membrane dipeptidase [Armatimonadota bacterium]